MKKHIILWVIVEFIVLISAYVLALTLSCINTSARLDTMAEQAYEILDREGNYPVIYDDEAIRIDNFTDRILVEKTTVSDEQSFISAMWMDGYFRYWHGYVPFLKPALSVFGFNSVRKIAMMVVGALMVVCLFLLNKRLGAAGPVSFALMWADFYSSKVAGTLQFFWPYFIMCSAVIFICLFYDRVKEGRAAWVLLFFGIGSFVNYVDLLTFPLVTLTVPLIVLLLIKKENVQKNFVSTLLYSFVWGMGYALTWISKWLICLLFLPGNVVSNVLNTIAFRMNGDDAHPIDRLFVIRGNLNMPYFLHHTGFILLALVLLTIAYLLAVKDKKQVLLFVSLIPVLLYPYIWYEFFCSHSTIHAFFTYRAQMGTSLGLYFFLSYFAIETVHKVKNGRARG